MKKKDNNYNNMENIHITSIKKEIISLIREKIKTMKENNYYWQDYQPELAKNERFTWGWLEDCLIPAIEGIRDDCKMNNDYLMWKSCEEKSKKEVRELLNSLDYIKQLAEK